VPQVFLYDVGHRHAQRGRKILGCHALLLLAVLQKIDQAIRESLRVSRRMEFNSEFFAHSHLPEVRKVGGNDWHTVRAGEVSYSAATSRGGVRHHSHTRALEQIRQSVFGNVSAEFNSWVAGALTLYGFDVSMGLGMIAAGDDQFRLRHLTGDEIERLNHQFKTLVSSPFSKGENSVERISASREIGKLGAAGKNAVRAKMNVIAPVLIIQYFSIARHQHGNRIGEQKHPGRDRSSKAVQALVSHAHVFELDCVDQMMQGHVRVMPAETSEQRGHQPAESYKRIFAKRAEKQIEPDDVGFQTVKFTQ
jgi:hypothetical protein